MSTTHPRAAAITLAVVLGVVALIPVGVVAQQPSAPEAATPLSPTVARLHAMTMMRLTDSTREWIVGEGHRVANDFTDRETFLRELTAALRSRYGASALVDSAAIGQLVLAEAVTASAADLKARTRRTRILDDARARLTDCIEAARNEIGQNMLSAPSDPCSSEPCRALEARLPSVVEAVRRAGLPGVLGPHIAVIGDLPIVKAQAEEVRLRVETQAHDDADALEAVRTRQFRMLDVLREYVPTVSGLAGAF